MFSSALFSLFVCLQDYAKTTRPTLIKFGDKVGHGPTKKRLDSGGNLDRVTSGLGLGLRYG